jgi:hypothetical protein
MGEMIVLRFFEQISDELYQLHGSNKNPPIVYIDEIEGFIYTLRISTAIHYFYDRKSIYE